MKRNIAINGFTLPGTSSQSVSPETSSDVSLPLVEVNEGDAWYILETCHSVSAAEFLLLVR